MTAALRAALERESERTLSAEDVHAYLPAAPVGDVEREDVLALVEWFCRR